MGFARKTRVLCARENKKDIYDAASTRVRGQHAIFI